MTVMGGSCSDGSLAAASGNGQYAPHDALPNRSGWGCIVGRVWQRRFGGGVVGPRAIIGSKPARQRRYHAAANDSACVDSDARDERDILATPHDDTPAAAHDDRHRRRGGSARAVANPVAHDARPRQR